MPALVAGIHVFTASQTKTWMAGTSPAMTDRPMTAENVVLVLIHQIDVEDRQFENIGPAAFFNFEKQDRDEFVADIDFKRVWSFSGAARHGYCRWRICCADRH